MFDPPKWRIVLDLLTGGKKADAYDMINATGNLFLSTERERERVRETIRNEV